MKKNPGELIRTEILKGVELAQSHGHVRPGKGMISGLIALFLANFSLLGVLIFQFPSYLTTPKVRDFIGLDQFRLVLVAAMVVCVTISLYNLCNRRAPRLSAWALWWLALALIGSMLASASWAWVGCPPCRSHTMCLTLALIG